MNQRYKNIIDGCIIQSVSAFEVNLIVIMPEESLFTVYLSVFVTEHSPYSFLVSKRNTVKLVSFHFGIMPNDVFSDDKLFLSFKAWLEELKSAHFQHLAFFRHEEGWINTNAVVTEHLLGVPASQQPYSDSNCTWKLW